MAKSNKNKADNGTTPDLPTVGGVAAGAAVGSVLGPLGAAVGALVGGVAGKNARKVSTRHKTPSAGAKKRSPAKAAARNTKSGEKGIQAKRMPAKKAHGSKTGRSKK